MSKPFNLGVFKVNYKDKLIELTIKILTFITSIIIFFVIIFIVIEGIPIFKEVGIKDFVFQSNWNPVGNNKSYGILTMILGSIYVSLLALLIAFPIGIGCSVFLCFINKRARKIIVSFIDMLAGIPSVIFGFLGLVLLVKIFENRLNMTSGECVLAGGILLAIIILPFIITNCLESLLEGKNLYEESSLSLGVSKWFTIRKIVLPNSLSAVFISLILAFSRAMGETMAVMMVIGNSPLMPKLLSKAETIPSLIALEMGSVEYKSLHYHALYGAGVVLLVMLFVCNILFYILKNISKKGEVK